MLMQSNLVEYWTSELEHLFLTRLAKFYHLFPVHSWGPSRPGSCFHYHHDSSKGKIFSVIYPSLPLTLCPCLPSYVHLPPSPSLLICTLSKSHILSFSSFPPLSPSSSPLALLFHVHIMNTLCLQEWIFPTVQQWVIETDVTGRTPTVSEDEWACSEGLWIPHACTRGKVNLPSLSIPPFPFLLLPWSLL